eukprot:gene18109-50793_t
MPLPAAAVPPPPPADPVFGASASSALARCTTACVDAGTCADRRRTGRCPARQRRCRSDVSGRTGFDRGINGIYEKAADSRDRTGRGSLGAVWHKEARKDDEDTVTVSGDGGRVKFSSAKEGMFVRITPRRPPSVLMHAHGSSVHQRWSGLPRGQPPGRYVGCVAEKHSNEVVIKWNKPDEGGPPEGYVTYNPKHAELGADDTPPDSNMEA